MNFRPRYSTSSLLLDTFGDYCHRPMTRRCLRRAVACTPVSSVCGPILPLTDARTSACRYLPSMSPPLRQARSLIGKRGLNLWEIYLKPPPTTTALSHAFAILRSVTVAQYGCPRSCRWPYRPVHRQLVLSRCHRRRFRFIPRPRGCSQCFAATPAQEPQ